MESTSVNDIYATNIPQCAEILKNKNTKSSGESHLEICAFIMDIEKMAQKGMVNEAYKEKHANSPINTCINKISKIYSEFLFEVKAATNVKTTGDRCRSAREIMKKFYELDHGYNSLNDVVKIVNRGSSHYTSTFIHDPWWTPEMDVRKSMCGTVSPAHFGHGPILDIFWPELTSDVASINADKKSGVQYFAPISVRFYYFKIDDAWPPQ
ncbi:14152_t:CDS:2 [Funneliformis geosporum]|uniref:14152_t:CDS:1 n=1 Tax=Funneliformis geosporum TaxID=1117311 RepID=A0A9W4SW99_9GLOM|nr:14152_t:CDS:2 [Funneliformis geosporum]